MISECQLMAICDCFFFYRMQMNVFFLQNADVHTIITERLAAIRRLNADPSDAQAYGDVLRAQMQVGLCCAGLYLRHLKLTIEFI